MNASLHTRSTIVFALLALAARAAAQGSDACATAQAISGTGVFAFDTTAATTGTEGQANGNCLFFGQIGIESDVWYTWNATVTGTAKIETCGLATIDTKVAVYDGVGCPAAAALACNDDSCGLQSVLTFACVQGNDYTIQLGNYPNSPSGAGTGSFDLGIVPPPTVLATMVNPANGHTYHFLTPSSWSAAEAAAVALGGHLATVDDQAEHDWITASFHSYLGIDRDIWIGLNDVAVEGTFVWSSGASVGYTNWDLNEPNNAGGIEDCATLRKNNPAAFWNDLADSPRGFHNSVHGLVELGTNPFTAYCFGDGTLATGCPCSNTGAAGRGCDNSAATGGADLAASGTTSPDTVVLASSGELPTALTIFLQGDATISAGILFGDGVRCVAGVLKRLAVKNAVGGAASYPEAGDPSITTQSANLGDPIAPGSVRYYQVYYRDPDLSFCPDPPGNSWNVSGGVEVGW